MPAPPTPEDIQSRLGVRVGDNESQYDEIVAFTEQIINKNFAHLFELYPAMSKINFDDPTVGSIEAVIHPSQIIIPSDNSSKIKDVLFQIRFKTGRFRSANGLVEIPMDGWILTVDCPIGTQEVLGVAETGQPKSTDVTKQVFAVPGDYTAERMFAQISSILLTCDEAAKWGNPLAKYSTFGINDKTKKPKTYQEWCDEFDPTGNASTTLNSIMSGWARKQEERGRSTLGVTFSLKDPSKIDPEKPLYTPTYLFQQIHPYKDPVHEAKMREIETRFPLQADTSLNCLLYCEMVDNHERPKNLTLNHHGNFVTRGTTLSDSDDQIDGAFVLGYKHFLENYLLPRIKPLNQASDIYVHPVSWLKDARGGGNHTVDWQYSVGSDPEHPSSNDGVYDYKRYPSAHVEDKSVAHYEFTKHNSKECADHAFDATSHHKYIHQSDASVKVTWESGGKTFHIAGNTTYVYDSKWCHTSNFNDEGQIYGKLKLTYKISWNFDITLADANNGVLNIIVNENCVNGNVANLKVEPNKEVQTGVTTPTNQDNEIAAEFQQKIKTSLDLCVQSLKNGLVNTGKFVYPGNGTLRFLNPCINRHGNVLAELEYLPLKKGEVIQVPVPHQAALPQIARPAENPVTVSSGVCAPMQKMTWSTVQTNPAASVLKEMTTAEIKITATNETDSDQYFGHLSVTFKSGKGPGNFFDAAQIHRVGAETKGAAQIQPGAGSKPDEEEPEPKYTVDLDVSEGVLNVDKNIGLSQIGQIANSDIILWQIIVRAKKNEAIIVPQGGSIALKFYIRTGGEGTYTHTVYESFRDENDPTEPPEDGPINSGNHNSSVVLAPNPEARAAEAAKKEAAAKMAAEKKAAAEKAAAEKAAAEREAGEREAREAAEKHEAAEADNHGL
ncbi:hypothetical protein QBC44DRAFT_247173 [Cladorrhinum sp. PSN332]|nr:hypothetical protein QBC44DRAFT_247173 [Cladorrhinum sp. PSN332]